MISISLCISPLYSQCRAIITKNSWKLTRFPIKIEENCYWRLLRTIFGFKMTENLVEKRRRRRIWLHVVDFNSLPSKSCISIVKFLRATGYFVFTSTFCCYGQKIDSVKPHLIQKMFNATIIKQNDKTHNLNRNDYYEYHDKVMIQSWEEPHRVYLPRRKCRRHISRGPRYS